MTRPCSRFPSPRSTRLIVALALLCGAVPTQAQLLRGMVVSAPGDSVLAGASILIYTDESVQVRATQSDALGRFEIELPGEGVYALLARHPDFPDSPSRLFVVEPNHTYEVTVRLARDVMRLEPIEVEVRRLPRTMLDAANQRISENRHFGIGLHMTRDEIESSGRTEMNDLLGSMAPTRIRLGMLRPPMVPNGRGGYSPAPGSELPLTQLTIRSASGWCPLRTYVDGVYAREGIESTGTPVNDVAAIEVYEGPHPQGPYYDPSGCGIALIWTHHAGSPNAAPRESDSWRHWAGGVGVMLLLGITFMGW